MEKRGPYDWGILVLAFLGVVAAWLAIPQVQRWLENSPTPTIVAISPQSYIPAASITLSTIQPPLATIALRLTAPPATLTATVYSKPSLQVTEIAIEEPTVPPIPVATKPPRPTNTLATTTPLKTQEFHVFETRDTLLFFRTQSDNAGWGYLDRRKQVLIWEGDLDQQSQRRKVKLKVAIRRVDYDNGFISISAPIFSTIDGANIGSSWQEKGRIKCVVDPYGGAACEVVTGSGEYAWPTSLVGSNSLNASLVDVVIECWVDERLLRLP